MNGKGCDGRRRAVRRRRRYTPTGLSAAQAGQDGIDAPGPWRFGGGRARPSPRPDATAPPGCDASEAGRRPGFAAGVSLRVNAAQADGIPIGITIAA
ncbi:hypothetical protein HMPREF0043_01429 [Actinobaculum sp. oral taxon 183 str. F0552]|nr:hypothetical protein HMPREF0043_01429 [Actinobaculum sp. oral taxon 183 str. F0552]